jgi:glutamine synthetase
VSNCVRLGLTVNSEVTQVYDDALDAADDSAQLKYAAKEVARANLEILGTDSVLDFAAIARSEWLEYQSHASDRERRRYLASS